MATGSGPAAANKTLFRDLGFSVDRDFEPISLVGVFPIVIVASTKLPVTTLSEMVAYAKERPGQLNYGSVGIGSSQHLAGAYFEQAAGLKLTHVPYRNIAQYAPDLMAGTVPLGFQWLPNVAAPLAAGGAKAIAVAIDQRMAALPDVPTTAEAGMPNYQASGWSVLLAPKGTPKPIVTKLNQELKAALAEPSLRIESQSKARSPSSCPRKNFPGSYGRSRQMARHHHQGGYPADPIGTHPPRQAGSAYRMGGRTGHVTWPAHPSP